MDRFLLFLCFLKSSLAEIVLEHDIFPYCRVKIDNLHDVLQKQHYTEAVEEDLCLKLNDGSSTTIQYLPREYLELLDYPDLLDCDTPKQRTSYYDKARIR